jgi:DNA invertase Pin-like site-specific DNA recombinase
MKCVVYARVSTAKQSEKELSIPAQLEAARAYARERGWTIVDEYVESGVSGTSANRPALKRLLGAVQNPSGEVQVVLVHKVDRLARNVYDHATIRTLLKKRGVQLASVVENVDDTVSGQLVENIMASIAQFYSANLGEEVKKGMRQRVLGGGWPHAAPVGYSHVRNDDGKGSHVEIHPRLGPLVRRAFELFASGGHSIKSLGAALAAEGLSTRNGGPLAPSHLQKLLTNPFYIGQIRWMGTEVSGRHEPLVSHQLFQAVRGQLAKRRTGKARTARLPGVPLRGVAICASCRGHMTAERHGPWTYYRCSRQAYRRTLCPAKFCNADVAHDSLRSILTQLQISRTAAGAIKRSARKLISQRGSNRRELQSAVWAKRRDLLHEKSSVTREFADARVNAAEALERTKEIDAELGACEVQERRVNANPRDVLAQLERLVDLASTLWDLYAEFDDDARSKIVGEVFEVVTLNETGIVGFTLRSGFDVVAARDGVSDHELSAKLLDAVC